MDSAFVLHARPWRETSLLLELLTFESGRIGVLARGARRPRRGGSSLQPFNLLELDWRGRGELPTLVNHEILEAFVLTGTSLYGGLYLNEVLMRVLRRGLAQPEIFRGYSRVLTRLHHQQPLEPSLRRFELELVAALGFGISLAHDTGGAPIRADRDYVLQPEAGLRPACAGEHARVVPLAGAHLQRIAADDLADPAVLGSAKRLTRQLLAPLLGDAPLRSRALFRQQVVSFRKPG